MPRGKSKQGLNEDFLDVGEPAERKEDLLGAVFYAAVESQEENGLLPSPWDAEAEPLEDELDEVALEEQAQEAEEEEPAGELEGREAEPKTLAGPDDLVGMYLQEIARVRLLTAADERTLARNLDGGKHLQALEKEFADQEGHPPQPWEITWVLLHRVAIAASLVEALGEHLGLPADLTLAQMTNDTKLRAGIDGKLSQEMLAAVALILEEPPERRRGQPLAG